MLIVEDLMDHQALAQLLGNYGEFVGAIAVVVTLFYLAVQVRYSREATEANTRSLEEARRLAMAQAYQARADINDQVNRELAESTLLPQLILKHNKEPDSLDDEEKFRLQCFRRATLNRFDNMHYQFEQDFLDQDYYDTWFKDAVVALAPQWRAVGLKEHRRSFRSEVDRILGLSGSESST